MGKRWALFRDELVMDFTPQGTDTYLLTRQADDCGDTARMGSPSAAAVGPVLYRVDDTFPEPTEALIRQDSTLAEFCEWRNFWKKRNTILVVKIDPIKGLACRGRQVLVWDRNGQSHRTRPSTMMKRKSVCVCDARTFAFQSQRLLVTGQCNC